MHPAPDPLQAALVAAGPDPEAKVLGGRFRVLRSLKRGQGVETLLGLDLLGKQLVVIKTADGQLLPLADRLRLEHEAMVLSRLQCKGVAPLLSLDHDGDLLYLVMAHIPGTALEERLATGPLSIRDAVALGQHLLSALREIHDHGVLHRDLKPANIIIEGENPLRRATLIDFGLSRSAWLDASLRDQPVGTARYLSPEMAGMLDHRVDERSDLYSAGVVLFECLAGRPPFEAESVGDLLWQHMAVRPPSLRGLRGEVPRALDEIVQRLLRKDPADRYQSAEGALADLDRLADALARNESDPPLVVGLHDRRRTLTEPAFVGRDSELAALEAELARATRGEGGLVLVEAESGCGKTRLLEELARRAEAAGAWVLRGQGLDQAAQRPFQLLVGLTTELIAAVGHNPGLGERVRARLGEGGPAVRAALPELAGILGAGGDDRLGPETFGHVRSQQALAALLDALGDPGRPALVLLDDCQWADEQTLRLLRDWQQRSAGPRHLCMVAAFRAEEAHAEHLLRRLKPAVHLTLPPLGPDVTRLLAESMAGPLPAEALDVVERFSEGSPFLAAAVLQGLVESGALVAGEGGWQIDSPALADVQSSRHVATFLVRRVERLPPAVLALLSAGAVLGKEFQLEVARELAQQTEVEAQAALDEARRRHVVWGGRDAPCAFVHDRLRQTLLNRLTLEARSELHRRAALYLEERAPRRVFELAYHFDAAGDARRALPYALAAAEQARAQHSLEVAERQYHIALRGAPDEDLTTRFELMRGLGEVLMLRGRYAESAQAFEAAQVLAGRDLDRASIEGKIGELAFKRDDVVVAGNHIEHALRLLGRRIPTWGIAYFFLMLWEVLIQTLHSLLPRWFLGRRKLEGAERDLLAMRLYSRLAHLNWFRRGTVPALWAHLRGLNLAERYPPTLELAQAWSEHAPGMSLLCWFSRGIAYAQKSLEVRKAFGDPWGQGQSLHFYGVVLYAASRFREAIDRCREAIRLLGRTGDQWEVSIARFQVAASLYRLGRLREAVLEAQKMHQSGIDLGDAQASGISLDIWSRASLGRVPAELVQTELLRPSEDVQRAAQVLLAEGVRLLYANRPGEAVKALRQAQDRLDRAGVRNAWTAPVLPWLTTALRRLAEQVPGHAPGRRSALLRAAWRTARRALRVARGYKNELPQTLRELGILSAMRGRPRKALRYLDQSLTVASEQEARYEAALTRQARGQLGIDLGWPGAAQDLLDARQLLTALEAGLEDIDRPGETGKPATLSLVDRFDTLLESGRRLASALSREAIFNAARESALKLLRGERCIVLKVASEAENIELASGEIEGPYSQALVKRALAAGRSVAYVEGAPENSSESAVLTGARSALCAPVFVRGQPVGCFYVTHRSVAGLFAEEERRLADFIATLTGAALENAEGFAELRRLNQALELRIQELRLAQSRIQEQAALLDKAQDAISVQDLGDHIQFWNRSAERLYGWTAEEARGRPASELLYRRPSAAHRAAMSATLKEGEWSGELTQSTRSGREVIVESRWTLVRDDAGRPRALLVTSTDVTERRKLEAQFLRAQRMESVGQLAGGVAHDVNNALTPIVLSLQLLRMEQTPEQRDLLLSNLETVALRAADMVRQILAFARGVEGERAELHLKHVLKELHKLLVPTFPKSIEIDVDIARDLWLIKGDSTQLHQMLMNLCVNARDAMPNGGKLHIAASNVLLSEAEVRGYPDARPGPHVRLTVADTGMGIPPELLDRIFDPFFTTKEYGKGTGLGLATVLGIVKGHGGFVQVTSEPGRGTQMSVFLPALEAPTRKASAPAPESLPAGHGELILVVDDEETVREVIRRNLQEFGYQVLLAREGGEALELWAQERGRVRAVLTDLMMPGVDGSLLIQALRREAPTLPLLAMSGLATDPPPGADLVLQKPFRMEDLLRTIHDAVSRENRG